MYVSEVSVNIWVTAVGFMGEGPFCVIEGYTIMTIQINVFIMNRYSIGYLCYKKMACYII